MIGSFTSVIFLLVVAGTLERMGILVSFSLTLLATVLMHGCSYWLMQRRMSRVSQKWS